MSTNIIDFSNINYANSNHVFVTKLGDETIDNASVNTIRDLLDRYEKIFENDDLEGEKSGKEYSDLILTQLKSITGIESFYVEEVKGNVTINIDNIINYTSDFYASAKKIEGKLIDENCLEGYRAYSFYLEKIILLLNKLHDAIKQGQDAIDKIRSLTPDGVPANQTVEEYVNGKVHELSAELYMADKDIADVMSEFQSCLKYNANTKSWDTASYDCNTNNVGNPSKLQELRELKVPIEGKINNSNKHQITCFGELNLMDKLRYIHNYYYLILKSSSPDSNYQVFPDDSETGYPCIPDKESTTDTKATESMGGFELFYVGYLVDRDGSIDAYSSCLEAKSKAITDNVSLQSKHIEAYNQYLTFINRAAQLHNETQGKNKEATNIAYGAHLGLTYFCGGTMRDLLEVDGVNYIVLSYTDKDGSQDSLKPNSDFKYGLNHRYLLVRADDKGLKALYNTNSQDCPNGGVNEKQLEMITAGDLEPLFTGYSTDNTDNKKSCTVTCDCQLKDNSGKNFGYPGTIFYGRAHSTDYSSNYPIIVSSSLDSDKREILIWDMAPEKFDKDKKAQEMFKESYNDLSEDQQQEIDKQENTFKTNLDVQAQEMFEKNYNDLTVNEKNSFGIKNAENYLPKRLTAQPIEPDSVAQYENYRNVGAWGDSAEAKNRVINSWTTAFSTKSEYINTAIEMINTDITALRTKMDTIDSLCSTLRNRSFETKKTLVSNLRS